MSPDSPVFRAKNVKPDFLELRVPVWVNDLCFPDALEPGNIESILQVAAEGGKRLAKLIPRVLEQLPAE